MKKVTLTCIESTIKWKKCTTFLVNGKIYYYLLGVSLLIQEWDNVKCVKFFHNNFDQHNPWKRGYHFFIKKNIYMLKSITKVGKMYCTFGLR